MTKKNQKSLTVKKTNQIISYENIRNKIFEIRSQQVLLDSDIAEIYGVETRRINEAVSRNKDKFPTSYMFKLTKSEIKNLQSQIATANFAVADTDSLRSQFATANLSAKRRTPPKVFTEKGLYMLATILKSKNALNATFAIIETFAKVRELKREIKELHTETDVKKQAQKMKKFGAILADLISPDLETSEVESTLELNLMLGKITHTVKRIKKKDKNSGASIC